ncbi:TspO/MBR family protein [Bacillus sp. FJAT-47783]|uniref:TspO/MBR family protein n=1 Tax=Bacillus sp. FJAT-47783 TaxID=2922712 RepID=UPI001FAE273C|nr:TspO/MBR family protein [Bacillus sp. FJAT-47783]
MKISSLLVFFIVYAGSFIFSIFSNKRPFWYRRLKKSSLTPPGHVIGIVWSILYLLIAFSVSMIHYRHGFCDKTKRFYSLFGINYLFNQAFGFLFFTCRSRLLGMLDTIVVAITSIWLTFLAKPLSKVSSYLLIPYALWTTFASYLSYKVYVLNR